jgi:hypothetical protein
VLGFKGLFGVFFQIQHLFQTSKPQYKTSKTQAWDSDSLLCITHQKKKYPHFWGVLEWQ